MNKRRAAYPRGEGERFLERLKLHNMSVLASRSDLYLDEDGLHMKNER